MDINDIIDSIYKLPDASKEALLSDAPEVAYPKGFHLFRANHKNSKFYLMKKGMLHAYTYQSDKKVTFWFGKEGDAIFPLQTLHDNRAGYENIELLEDADVKNFVGEYEPEDYLLNPECPMAVGPYSITDYYMEAKRNQAEGTRNVSRVVKEVAE